MKERRRYVRLKLESTMEYYNDRGQRMKVAPLVSVSGGGVCFLTKEPLEGKKNVKMSFVLPGDDSPIKATVEIVWVRDKDGMKGVYEVGANFVALDHFDREKIGDYVYNHLKA
ncbi:MAG: PilZ domain-containing protein [bacterium]